MAERHLHRLKKHKYPKTGNSVFFCTKDCNYKVEVALAVGKIVECNICGNEFTMTEASLKLVRPHCLSCGRRAVKDKEGKKHYVNKVRNQTLTSIAADKSADLRERLSSITKAPTDTNDDI